MALVAGTVVSVIFALDARREAKSALEGWAEAESAGQEVQKREAESRHRLARSHVHVEH